MKKNLLHFTFLFLLVGCQTKQEYSKIIEERAKQSVELSYSGIKIGDKFTLYGDSSQTETKVKDIVLHLPDFSSDEFVGIVGDVQAHILVDQFKKDNKVDAINIAMDDYGYVMESLVNEYVKKYGIYSSCTLSYGFPGSASFRQDTRIPNDDVLCNPEQILRDATTAKRNIQNNKARIDFIWKWKNGTISVHITYWSPNTLYLTFSE